MGTEKTTQPHLQTILPGPFAVEIAGLDLLFVKKALTDPVPTGRQIAETFSADDPSEVMVLQVLPNGVLEEIRPDETANLLEEGAERFIVVRSDRSFRFEVDGRRQEWPSPVVSAMTIKVLSARTGDDVAVVLHRSDAPDRELDDHDLVALSSEGVERFSLTVRPRTVTVKVNTKAVILNRGLRTGLEIKQAAIDQGVAIKLDFLLSIELGHGHTEHVRDNEPIRVKDGQEFVAIPDDDNS